MKDYLDLQVEIQGHVREISDCKDDDRYKREIFYTAKKLYQLAKLEGIDLHKELTDPSFKIELEFYWEWTWKCKCGELNETRIDPEKEKSFCRECKKEGQNYEMTSCHGFECPLCGYTTELYEDEEYDEFVECFRCEKQFRQ